MRIFMAATASLLLAAIGPVGPALAQSAAPAPVFPLKLAQKAAQAAFTACKGTPIAVAVLDSGAGARLVLVGDGARSLFADFARRKAATALHFGKPSADVRDEAKNNPELAALLKSDPALIGFGGGIPFTSPFTSGAIAVAGAPSQDADVRCALAGKAVLEK